MGYKFGVLKMVGMDLENRSIQDYGGSSYAA